MYDVGNALLEEAIQDNRYTWRIMITDETTGLTYTGESVMSAESDAQTTADSEDIQLGAVCAGSWSITLYNPDRIKFLGHKLRLSLYLNKKASISETTWSDLEASTVEELDRLTIYQITHLSENAFTLWGDLELYTCGDLDSLTIEQIEELGSILGEPIPMGVYYVVRSRQNEDLTELTVYDRLYWSDTVYTPSERLTFPCTSSQLEQDILSQLGITSAINYSTQTLLRTGDGSQKRLLRTVGGTLIRVSAYSFEVQRKDIPEDATMRQVLGWLAACQGQFGVLDRLGRYVRRWYIVPAISYVITGRTVTTPTLSERPNTINGLICNTGSTTLTIGDVSGQEGRVIEFENPFMTQALFRSLWCQIRSQGLEWYTAELTQILGDPRLDPGDVLTYTDRDGEHLIPVTGLAFGFDGGLWADIKAVGKNYEEELII